MVKLINKSLLILMLIIGLVPLNLTPASAASGLDKRPLQVYVQDKRIHPTQAPVIQNGRVYVEFRSVALALGLKFKYDERKQVITASSEDVIFNIDLKDGITLVNGREVFFDEPMIIESGINTLVMIHLFNPSEHFNGEYNPRTKTVHVYEDPWGKPKKSDLKAIESFIREHYRKIGYANSVDNLKLESWGEHVTMTADVTIPKNGTGLVDRMEHSTISMNREENHSWSIFEIASETEYLDYKSLSNRQVAVPEADKAAIYSLLEAHAKAINEENADMLIALRNPDIPLGEGFSSIEEVKFYVEYTLFRDQALEYTREQNNIVSYEPNKAVIYEVTRIKDKEHPNYPHVRTYVLTSVVKASDGKWYLNPDEDLGLGSEKL
ncbi:hypothetical protein J7E73_26340 [Paenibacillus albidus]|uniref:stalk domain-containing protein n=1 Tax=Paenibacillus albidus TaxID=2041023 RepID=UPI001BE5214A|nr:stalk domain-containing protein [Paenibacillus albidus]MBT2292591.1 hypothetical protein [Paenibacillus albidus]